MVKLEKHLDGIWYTSEYTYKGKLIVIKSADHKGIKAHCLFNGKEVFTLRYSFIHPDELLIKMKNKIDMWDSGEWIPMKFKSKTK